MQPTPTREWRPQPGETYDTAELPPDLAYLSCAGFVPGTRLTVLGVVGQVAVISVRGTRLAVGTELLSRLIRQEGGEG